MFAENKLSDQEFRVLLVDINKINASRISIGEENMHPMDPDPSIKSRLDYRAEMLSNFNRCRWQARLSGPVQVY